MLKVNISGQMSEEAANRAGFIEKIALLIAAISLFILSITFLFFVYFQYGLGIK